MKKAAVIMLSVLLLALSACNPVQVPATETNATAIVPTTIEMETTTDWVYSGFIPNTDYPLAIWVGAYHFVEQRSSTEYMQYTFKLFRANAQYYAYVERRGWRGDEFCLWFVSVNGTEHQIDLIFERTLKDDHSEFKQGQVLLTLSLQNQKLFTTWQAIQPGIESTPIEGQTFWRGTDPGSFLPDYDSIPEATEASHNLSSWIGNYSYEDGTIVDDKGLFAYFYDVTIYEYNDMYWAYLTVEGRGCAIFIHAAVQGDAESVQLLFVRTLPLSFPTFEEHSVKTAFTLTKKNGELCTKWGEIWPYATSYEEGEGIEGTYFKEVVGSNN
ncbi:MAG: DUF5991 domain-containing protein [Dehalococcoidia bacterium]|nr:DUF5991 domain-containing protein [Dehalococcoidia bacterium]